MVDNNEPIEPKPITRKSFWEVAGVSILSIILIALALFFTIMIVNECGCDRTTRDEIEQPNAKQISKYTINSNSRIRNKLNNYREFYIIDIEVDLSVVTNDQIEPTMRAAAIDFKKKTRNAEFVHLLLHHRGCNDIIGHGYYSIDGKDLDGRPTPKAWSGSHIIGDFPLTQPSLDAVNLYCEAMKPGSRFFTGTQFDEALYQKEIKEKLKMDVIQYLESTSIMAFPKYVSF